MAKFGLVASHKDWQFCFDPIASILHDPSTGVLDKIEWRDMNDNVWYQLRRSGSKMET